jgi:hypothetical protein
MSTAIAVDRAERVQRNVDEYRADAMKDDRAKALECKSCFYLARDRVAGQAFTAWRCGVCGAEHVHHNTNVPKVCDDCASRHDLCTVCGGDREMRAGRRKWPEGAGHDTSTSPPPAPHP